MIPRYDELKAWVNAGTPEYPRAITLTFETPLAEGAPVIESVYLFDAQTDVSLHLTKEELELDGIHNNKWIEQLNLAKDQFQSNIDRVQAKIDELII